MSFCMFYCVVVSKEKTFTCMVGRYVWGVAGKASNLSCGAGFAIVRKGWCGLGGVFVWAIGVLVMHQNSVGGYIVIVV